MKPADLDGNASFYDHRSDSEVNTKMRITLDVDLGRVVVGEGDGADEIVFQERDARLGLARVVEALQRREYRRRPIHPVPKPISEPCDICGGKRFYVDAYSGEVYRCPSCG